MRKILLLPFLFFLFLPFSNSFCQSTGLSKDLYTWFDTQIGIENTRLFNGKEYVEKHRTINSKNKFLNPGAVSTGEVMYDGQWFSRLNMKYNIYDDLLLVQLEGGFGNVILQLIKEKVERFSINDQVFLNVSSKEAISGFHEILWEDEDLAVLKKYSKKLYEKKDRAVTYYEFENTKGYFAFRYKDSFQLLRTQKDLLTVFPEQKEFISNYFRKNSRGIRKDPAVFYPLLFRELSQHLEDHKPLAQQ